MTVQTHTMLDSQMALDLFRSEHYLYVYSTALELTASPSEAQQIAAQVFENAARRFAHKPLPANCDMYLAAQTHLIYAQQILPGMELQQAPQPMGEVTPQPAQRHAEAPRGQAHTAYAATAGFDSAYRAGSNAAPQPAPSYTPPAATPMPQPDTAAPGTPQPAPAYPQAMPAQAFSAAQATPATVAAQPMPMIAWMPLGQGISFMQVGTAGQAVPVMQAVPITQVASPAVQAATAQPQVAAAPPTNADSPAPEPVTPPAAEEQPATPATPEPPAGDKAGPAVCDALYNQDDTEYWTPDGEACEAAAPEPAEITPSWEAEDRDKPSVALSLINGLLALLSLASIGFLLFELNILPKQF